MGAYEINLIVLACIAIILALGLNMITGFCGQISLGHAAFFGAGAYTTAMLMRAGWPLIAAMPVASAVAGVFGLIVGLTSLRVRHDFLAITTMGVGFLFLGIVRKQPWFGAELGISGIPDHGLGAIGFVVLASGLAAGVILLSLILRRSWLGFAFSAVADDEDTARALGINIMRFKLAAFVLGTMLAGVAGGLYAGFTRFVIPDAFGFTVSISILAMVIVGGIGSTWGVVIAASFLTLMPEIFRSINDYKLVLYGALLLIVMRFAPDGLAGLTRRLLRWSRS